MSFSFEPQIIKQDSAVPIRMMAFGWIVAVAVIFLIGPVTNRAIAIMGISLVAGGLIGLALKAERMYRMVLGATAGAFTTWFGFRFAFTERLLPAIEDPLEFADIEHAGAVTLGLSVMAIGLGGVLEAVRAQRDPGTSPLPVRVYLIVVGLVISGGLANAAGVSGQITIVLAIAVAVGLAAMAFLRNERPLSDFVPQS